MLQPASYLTGMERKAGLKLVWLKLAYSVGTRVTPRPWAAKKLGRLVAAQGQDDAGAAGCGPF